MERKIISIEKRLKIFAAIDCAYYIHEREKDKLRVAKIAVNF